MSKGLVFEYMGEQVDEIGFHFISEIVECEAENISQANTDDPDYITNYIDHLYNPEINIDNANSIATLCWSEEIDPFNLIFRELLGLVEREERLDGCMRFRATRKNDYWEVVAEVANNQVKISVSKAAGITNEKTFSMDEESDEDELSDELDDFLWGNHIF